MALIVADRVKQESTTTGTGTFTLAGSVDGFQNFSDVCSTNDTMYYVIQEKIGTDFEVGHGTFNSSGQLERTNILQSSNSDNAVNFGSGTKDVFITYPADKAVFQNYDGSITIPSTIDGRDLANDGSKLDGIEASATADQTAAEIRTLVESATDSNVFTDADHTKLNGIEASATADQTDAEIRAAVEAATDSNVFTDADHTKLNGIETSADVTDATNVDAAGAIMNSDVATKGQIIVGDGSGDPTILSVGTDGHYLKADSSAGSGVAWASIPAGVGGANGVDFNDDVKARFGDGNDLEIYHDGNDSYIKDSAGTGDLLIQTNKLQIVKANALDTMAKFTGDGAVELRYDDSVKFETTATGCTVTGTLSATTLSGAISGNISQLTNNSGYLTQITSGGATTVSAGNGIGLNTGNGTITMSGSYSGSFSATGNITAYSSDERLKNFKGKIENALDKVNKLSGNYFEWNDTAKGIDAEAFKDGVEVGVIAQEVEKVMPEVVTEAPIVKIHNLDTDYKTVHYDKLVPLLIEAIKQLKAEIETLKKKCECCE